MPTTTTASICSQVQRILLELYDGYTGAAEHHSAGDLLGAADLIEGVGVAAMGTAQALRGLVIRRLGVGTHEVDGWQVKVRSGQSRARYENDRLLAEVIEHARLHALYDEDGNYRDASEAEMLEDAVDNIRLAVAEVFGLDGESSRAPRLGAAAKYVADPYKYRHTEPGPDTLQVLARPTTQEGEQCP